MSYFFDIEQHHDKLGLVKQKGRVYRVVDSKGNLKWYEISQVTTANGEKLAEACFAVFDLDAFDIARALSRKIKVGAATPA